jgi:hypothetical protein
MKSHTFPLNSTIQPVSHSTTSNMESDWNLEALTVDWMEGKEGLFYSHLGISKSTQPRNLRHLMFQRLTSTLVSSYLIQHFVSQYTC